MNEFGRMVKPVDGGVLRGLSNLLMDHLADHFVDACKLASTNKATEIGHLGNFLRALRKEFDIGIVTLNYDDIFTQATSGLDTGFNSSGDFEPLSVLTHREWNFIYHLHGSIHFAMTGTPDDRLHGISWRQSPGKDHFIHSTGRSAQNSMEGILYPTSSIVAGFGKTQQILRQPFRTYFAKVNQLVHEADSFLFLGYGFGDLHLNAAFSEARNRPRPTLIIDWANNTQDPLPFRQDNWSYNLFTTLPYDAHKMSAPGMKIPANIKTLKANNEVECSNNPDYPLAVWYNGMLEACKNASALLPYLR
ncbi:SIR2 family protein [Acidiphilium multivorum]|nr:SIR2 family protein [Acidiphilium multivorum]